ncbi:MAG: EAL domain-containing protein [Chloroflexota bacterium]|nr:EAL domain-containing protein [Chloroflexota bacterium]
MDEIKFSKFSSFDNWFRPRGARAILISFVILLLIVGTYFFVYATGGITYVYSHSMYIAIILASVFFRMPGGILAGILGGLILGPIMPLDVHTGEMQSTINWLYRLFIFSLTGGFLGYVTTVVDNQLRKIEWQFYHDSLTKLPNLSYLEMLIQRINQNADPRKYTALFVLNINNFNEVSDTFGMENAATLLHHFSQRINQTFPDTTLCELMPSVMGMVLRLNDIDSQIPDTVNRIQKLVNNPYQLIDVPIFLDISVGVATCPDQSTNPSIIIRRARNAALTARKKRVDYWIFEEPSDLLSKERLALMGSVNQAIHENQFKIHYQPILNILDGTIAGMEALTRWMHPKRGLLSPAEFIPYMEDTSLMYAFQEWLIDTVFQQVKTWSNNGRDISCSINISARGLNHLKFDEPIIKLLEEYRIPSHQVMFEITESVVMLDPEEAIASLIQMKEAGFKLAIDDFGTGYSSLNYLKNLPVDYLKIDLDFIRDLHKSKEDQEIVRAIITSAKALGLEKKLHEAITETWPRVVLC